MTDKDRLQGSVMTSAMLKAMSHPLRRRMIKVLSALEYARAADIAEALDTPANSVSFHLRVLADAGMIVEAPERARDRRDRVWTAVKGALNLGSPEHPVEDEVLGESVLASLAQEHIDLLRRVVAWAPEFTTGRSADVHGAFVRQSLRLTVAEFEEMLKAIALVVEEARDAHDPSDPDSRLWELDTVAGDDRI